MRDCALGIDTSNYTTSLALVDRQMQVLANIKIPLSVKEGERGLRQSDAVFAHVKNLPLAFEELKKHLEGCTVSAVGVSARPRNHAGSYMPCFLSGVSAANAVTATLGVPLYEWSHQCGHIMAAVLGADALSLLESPFGAFHVSGGTTELVTAKLGERGFDATVVGGSLDLHAGQVIDRIGVMLGLKFPCGAALEALAAENEQKIPRKRVAAEGCYVHLSGLENMAADLYRKTADVRLTAAFVFDYVGASLESMADAFVAEHGDMPLVFGGGVMSSHLLRARLAEGRKAFFAPPALSSDNAVGVAALTARKFFS